MSLGERCDNGRLFCFPTIYTHIHCNRCIVPLHDTLKFTLIINIFLYSLQGILKLLTTCTTRRLFKLNLNQLVAEMNLIADV